MTLVDDVRALGAGAPLRAAYELSKRAGGHALIFGRVAKGPPPPSRIRLLAVPHSISEELRRRTLDHADRICSGVVEVFGREIAVGDEPDWHSVLHDVGCWPQDPWWTIDIRSDSRVGDVKWCWEMARMRHVVILARACRLEPDADSYRHALRRHVSSFLDQNPAERGVHWYSNLELSLRAYAWLQVVSLAETALGPELTRRLIESMHHTGRHLVADLPYTISTMRNNHLLGDAVGLCALGWAFSATPAGRRWTRIGDRLVERFLSTARRDDGTFIEDSLSYHRFVLDLLSARATLDPVSPSVTSALRDGAQFLCRLGVLDGPVPQYGDWDEGRALITSGDPCALAGSVAAALSLGGDGARRDWLEQHDEVAWYCGPGTAVSPEDAARDGRDIGGGWSRYASHDGGTRVWLKAPAGTSHNHADATQVAVWRERTWIVSDPGTGTYNGDVRIRNHFRSSVAHSVLRVGGIDQLEPHRAFRWRHRAGGGVVEPVRLDGAIVLGAWHDAYRRLAPPSLLVRLVVVEPASITIADFVEAPAAGMLSIPLGAGASVARSDADDGGDAVDATIGSTHVRIDVPGPLAVREGEEEPFAGWTSATYGEWSPAPLLEVESSATSPVTWRIAFDSSTASSRPTASTTPDTLDTGVARIAVSWSDGRAEIVVEAADGTRSVRRCGGDA